MADPIKVTGKDAEGAEHTISLDKPPAGLIAESEFESRFTERFERRATSLQKTALKDALDDDDYKATALAKWGIDPNAKPGDGEPSAERITALESQWTDRHVKPLREELDQVRTQNGALLGTRLKAEILAEAERVGVKKHYREKTEGMDQAMIVASTLSMFENSAEHDAFFVKGKEAGEYEYTTRAAADRKTPYRTVAEHFDLFGENKANADYIEEKRKRGPSHKGPPGPGAGGDVYITRKEAGRHDLFVAAEAKAKEQGGQLYITDE